MTVGDISSVADAPASGGGGLYGTEPPQDRQRLGRRGEELAARLLRRKGYEIIATNFRSRHGELDIVAGDGRNLVFVEVKTRTNKRFGEPFEAVTPRKQQRIRRMAEAWLMSVRYKHEYDNSQIRFDVVSLLLPPGGRETEIFHFEDAFR